MEAVKNGALTHAPYKIKMGAPRTGFITSIDALAIGNAARDLGAGRYVKTDTLDLHAGIVLAKKVGEKVEEGECLATIYAADIVRATEVGTRLLQAIEIGDHAVGVPPLIYGIVDKDGLQPYMP